MNENETFLNISKLSDSDDDMEKDLEVLDDSYHFNKENILSYVSDALSFLISHGIDSGRCKFTPEMFFKALDCKDLNDDDYDLIAYALKKLPGKFYKLVNMDCLLYLIGYSLHKVNEDSYYVDMGGDYSLVTTMDEHYDLAAMDFKRFLEEDNKIAWYEEKDLFKSDDGSKLNIEDLVKKTLDIMPMVIATYFNGSFSEVFEFTLKSVIKYYNNEEVLSFSYEYLNEVINTNTFSHMSYPYSDRNKEEFLEYISKFKINQE